MPLPPAVSADYSRALTYAGKLLEALEALDDARGLKRLTPSQAAALLPLLHDVRAEAGAAAAVLEGVVARPDRRGLVRRQANRPGPIVR